MRHLSQRRRDKCVTATCGRPLSRMLRPRAARGLLMSDETIQECTCGAATASIREVVRGDGTRPEGYIVRAGRMMHGPRCLRGLARRVAHDQKPPPDPAPPLTDERLDELRALRLKEILAKGAPARAEAARRWEREVDAAKAHILDSGLIVCGVGYAAHSEVEILCAGSTQAWGAAVVMPHLYRLTEGRHYSFVARLVNCANCCARQAARE